MENLQVGIEALRVKRSVSFGRKKVGRETLFLNIKITEHSKLPQRKPRTLTLNSIVPFNSEGPNYSLRSTA